jgi:hypothetical protein
MSQGGAANRMLVIVMIQASPPPRPACFSSDAVWKDWLIAAHLSGLTVTRRHDRTVNGQRQTSTVLLHTSRIDYCDSCTAGHQQAMQKVNRCHPSPVLAET